MSRGRSDKGQVYMGCWRSQGILPWRGDGRKKGQGNTGVGEDTVAKAEPEGAGQLTPAQLGCGGLSQAVHSPIPAPAPNPIKKGPTGSGGVKDAQIMPS